jgi:hypothetical protein
MGCTASGQFEGYGPHRLRKNPDGLDFYYGAVATGSTVPGAEPRGRKTTIEV